MPFLRARNCGNANRNQTICALRELSQSETGLQLLPKMKVLSIYKWYGMCWKYGSSRDLPPEMSEGRTLIFLKCLECQLLPGRVPRCLRWSY